jgi:uncharacterized membrane protein YiaA
MKDTVGVKQSPATYPVSIFGQVRITAEVAGGGVRRERYAVLGNASILRPTTNTVGRVQLHVSRRRIVVTVPALMFGIMTTTVEAVATIVYGLTGTTVLWASAATQ